MEYYVWKCYKNIAHWHCHSVQVEHMRICLGWNFGTWLEAYNYARQQLGRTGVQMDIVSRYPTDLGLVYRAD